MVHEGSQFHDLQSLCFGEELGSGYSRKVFSFAPDPKMVIKYAPELPKENMIEYEIWQMVKHVKSIARWFAPVCSMSTCGIFLLMERIERPMKKDYPARVPAFFGDLKYDNFGIWRGKFVCCDYSGFVSTSLSHKWSGQMKKAKWWD